MAPIEDKNFLKFFGKPLILNQIEALQKAGFKEILVVGGKHNAVRLRKLVISSLSNHNGIVAVVEQKDLELGMAGGVLAAKSWIKKDPFLLVSGNDIVDWHFSAYPRHERSECPYKLYAAKPQPYPKSHGLLLARRVTSYFPGGYLETNSKGFITNIVEKPVPGREPSKLVNIVVHYHPDPQILFNIIQSSAKQSRKGDDIYERALQQLFDRKILYKALSYDGFWQPLKYPWHVLELMQYYLKNLAKNFPHGRIGGKKAEVAKSAIIKGDVYLEDGVRVLDNAVINGPAYIGKNTVIATNALVRQSHIGENCVIGFGSEIARSFLGDNVWTHTNYIGDSIIGNDVSFGAGTVTGNLRLDEKPVSVKVSKKWNNKKTEERVDTGLNKLGLITGDHIRVGINTSFMPGIKIGKNSFIGAGIVVGQDVPEGSFVRGEWKLKTGQNKKITK